MAHEFSEDEMVGLIIVSCIFGFGVALIALPHFGDESAAGIGLVSTVLFGFSLGTLIKIVNKLTR